MKKVLVLGALLLTPMMVSAQQAAAGGGGGRGGAQVQPPPELRSQGGGTCARNVAEPGQPPRWEVIQRWNCANEPNPLPKAKTVWLEEMTWMDVRDAIAEGKTTVIIGTGGMEPNGPFLATGKHNYVLQANCEAIARKLGNALCAPIVKFVPEGNIETRSSHMASPGTISMRQETYEALLTDIAESLAMHGFEHIIFIGDSGSNGTGMTNVAARLNEKFPGDKPMFAHVPEHYTYGVVGNYMEEQGLIVDGESDNLHDDPIISLNMYYADPNSIRWAERVQAGLASINGVDLSDPVKNAQLAAAIVDFRANYTIEGIKRAIEYGGTVPQQGRGGGGGGRGGGAGGRAGGAGPGGGR